MKIIQTVFCNGPYGRFSELSVQGRTFYGVERPWKNNVPYKSCVPLGEYKLVWAPTTTQVPLQFDKHTWYMVGDTVSLRESDKLRWGCAWHIGNFDQDLQGCLAPGSSLGYARHKKTGTYNWCVNRSGDTMIDLLQLLGPEDHELVIEAKLMG